MHPSLHSPGGGGEGQAGVPRPGCGGGRDTGAGEHTLGFARRKGGAGGAHSIGHYIHGNIPAAGEHVQEVSRASFLNEKGYEFCFKNVVC